MSETLSVNIWLINFNINFQLLVCALCFTIEALDLTVEV